MFGIDSRLVPSTSVPVFFVDRETLRLERIEYVLKLETFQAPVVGDVAPHNKQVDMARASRFGAILLSTDLIRRLELGLKPSAGTVIDSGAYSQESRDAVYRELVRQLDAYLSDGAAVVDGTFGERAQRAPVIEVAHRHGATLVLVECTAPDDIVRGRQQRRQGEPWTVSQGSWEVFLAQKAAWEPANELPLEEQLVVDTTLPIADQLRLVQAALKT